MSRPSQGPAERSAADVARRVRMLRVQAGMTQEDLARAAKVTPKFVSQIENGHVNASIGVLSRLVEDGLGVPLALFFGCDPADDVMGEVQSVLALLANQPVNIRRCAIRLVRVLVEEQEAPSRTRKADRRGETYMPVQADRYRNDR